MKRKKGYGGWSMRRNIPFKSVHNDSMSFQESYARLEALTLVEIDEDI